MASPILIAGIGGIGGVLARRLVTRGTPVHLLARSGEKLAAVEKELQAIPRPPGTGTGSLVRVSTVDALDAPALASTVADVSSSWGGLRGLVYAIGSIPLKPFKSTTDADYELAWRLNFLGAAVSLRAAAPALAAGPSDTTGSVVFFSTVAAGHGFPNHAAIASAKGALEAFTRSAGAELAPRVRVNCISPSLTSTPLSIRMTGDGVSEVMKRGLADAHPLQRLGTAADSAALAEFLLDSKWSGWITGQVWAVDGGRSTLRPRN